MSRLECGKCESELKRTNRTIETVDPSKDYELSKVRIFTCEVCKKDFNVTEDDGGKAEWKSMKVR